MKSSYKIFGLLWDGSDIPKVPPVVKGESLIDSKKDRISLSFMLVLEDPNLLQKSIKGKDIILDFDYIPDFKAECIQEYYVKRILQIVQYIVMNSSGAECICNDNTLRKKINSMIADYYKEKAPNGLLAQSNGAFQMIC